MIDQDPAPINTFDIMDVIDIATCEDDKEEEKAESQMKLTDLIEDCLIHIFSLLDNKDLVNVAAVNSQFRDISRRLFSKNNKWIDILSAFEECSNAKTAFTMTKNLLQRFGDVIISTGFDYSTVKKKIMRKKVHDLIMKYCSNTLVEINFMEINNSLKFTKSFPNVKTLFFYDGSFHHSMGEIRIFFPNVERISFNNVEGLSWRWGFESQHIPSLQDFDNGYDCSHYAPKPDMGWYLDLIHLNHFIASNPQLRKLSTSLNSHKCWLWLTEFLEQNFVEIPENEGKVNDHPMNFKITAQSCAADCNVFDRLIVPFERVESLELCLKRLTASEFITKCRNIKNLRLYLRFDSHLFNALHFNKIASALPMLEKLFLSLETKQKHPPLFAEFMDFPPNQSNEIKYEKGSICAIHPFISQCRQLEKIEFRFTFEYREMDDSEKIQFSRKGIEDIGDFEKSIQHERLNWTSNNKIIDRYGVIGYTYNLTK